MYTPDDMFVVTRNPIGERVNAHRLHKGSTSAENSPLYRRETYIKSLDDFGRCLVTMPIFTFTVRSTPVCAPTNVSVHLHLIFWFHGIYFPNWLRYSIV